MAIEIVSIQFRGVGNSGSESSRTVDGPKLAVGDVIAFDLNGVALSGKIERIAPGGAGMVALDKPSETKAGRARAGVSPHMVASLVRGDETWTR